jgi:hypothetical protein
MRFTAIISCVLSLSFGIAEAQQQAAKAAPSQPSGVAVAPQTTQADLEALRSDLQRMKGLVQQMESNLAFVDTTQSPLKHQFQLEIDMWKTVIQQMERRLDHAASH